jgi:predicted DNA binding CopG/RHH family protein
VRVNLTMNESDLRRIDRAAAAAHETRSGWLDPAPRGSGVEAGTGAINASSRDVPLPNPVPVHEAGMVGVLDVELPGKTVRVNLTMNESDLRRIDRAAAAAHELDVEHAHHPVRGLLAEQRIVPQEVQ